MGNYCNIIAIENLQKAKIFSEKLKRTGIKLPKNAKKMKINAGNVHNKTVDSIVFAGFDDYELTELPGFQEAPQLLNGLSLKMGLQVNKIS